MSDTVPRGVDWIYAGVWGLLTNALRVPREAPTLPAQPGDEVLAFHPAKGFLRYLKFQFWIAFALVDGVILVIWLAITVDSPEIGLLLSPLALALAIVPDIVAYIGIHVLYDTTWYVLTRRSLRIRTGVLVLNEMTITFENVQNVTVNQGPLQRYFGIADVTVETAGGGAVQGPHGPIPNAMHTGIIKGIDNAEAVRGLIRERLGQSKSAGLGDDLHETAPSKPSWGTAHIAALREIRDLLR